MTETQISSPDIYEILPGSVLVLQKIGNKTRTHLFVKAIAFTLSSGALMIEGTSITRDGFTDGRSRGKTMHYIFPEDIIQVHSPAHVRYSHPYCQLRP